MSLSLNQCFKTFLVRYWKKLLFLVLFLLLTWLAYNQLRLYLYHNKYKYKWGKGPPERKAWAQDHLSKYKEAFNKHVNPLAGVAGAADESYEDAEDELDGYRDRRPAGNEDLNAILDIGKCPACFGNDFCDIVEDGHLTVDIPQSPNTLSRKGVYFGKYQQQQIALKTLVSKETFERFDRFICHNTTGRYDCDVSEAVFFSYMASEKAFQLDHLKQAYKLVHDSAGDLTFAACATSRLIKLFMPKNDVPSQNFKDEEGEDLAMAYTSLVLNPEAALLKAVAGFRETFPLPKFVGACGRSIIVEHGGKPLRSYIDGLWEERATLALQLLDLIHNFLQESREWLLMIGDFQLDNFAVSDSGVLKFVDLEHMLMVDKQLVAEYQPEEMKGICNEMCFRHFSSRLLSSASTEQSCAMASQVAPHIMYYLACKNILWGGEDAPDKADTTDNDEGGTEYKQKHVSGRKHRLLHDLPSRHKQTLTELLQECLQETQPGSRIAAISELREILQQYQIVHTR